jgi:hypothetical protein
VLFFQSGCKDTLSHFKLPNLFEKKFKVFFQRFIFSIGSFSKTPRQTASFIRNQSLNSITCVLLLSKADAKVQAHFKFASLFLKKMQNKTLAFAA